LLLIQELCILIQVRKDITIMTKEITIPTTIQNYISNPITIKSPEDMQSAVAQLSELNTTLDNLTASKELLTKPINEALKEIRGRYKPFEAQLEGAISYLRTAMTTYQTAQRKIELEKEAKIVARLEKGTLKVETAVSKLENLDRVDTKVVSDNGSVTFKTVTKWRVHNRDVVPNSFLIVNEVAINNAMRQGITVLGIEYYTEEQVVNKR